ncbi:MAG TPA: flavin reductase family protein [Bacillota bacterium]|nr:flavin reductase family protein [Bacillota bacterium]
MEEKINNFKEAMANYPTGVSVVTAEGDDGAFGITINSFASVSLEPLLILWSIDNNASTFNQFMNIEEFTVNILSGEQADVAQLFASSETEPFKHCDWSTATSGLPVINDSAASLQCKLYKRIEAGDHIILVGEVFHINQQDKQPLLYHNRHMGQLPDEFHESK